MKGTCTVDGITVFGRIVGSVLARDIEHVVIRYEDYVHATRHFSVLNRTSRDFLLSEAVKNLDPALNEQKIDQLLLTAGSKFNPLLDDLQATIATIISFIPEALSKKSYSWIQFQSASDKYFTEIYLSLNNTHKKALCLKSSDYIGTLGVTPITKDIEPLLQKETRGQGEETDRLTLHIIHGLKPPTIDTITICLMKDPISEQVFLTGSYTSDGKFSPLFPNADNQSDVEYRYSRDWWDRYAFFR
jgi:hypothetical protein